jgi:hypothetical protein
MKGINKMNFLLRILFLFSLTTTNGFAILQVEESIGLIKAKSLTAYQKGIILRSTNIKPLTRFSDPLDVRSSASIPIVQKRFFHFNTAIRDNNYEDILNDPSTEKLRAELRLKEELQSIAQGGEYADPISVVSFKRLFFPVEENKEIIKSFLNEVVDVFHDDPIEDVILKDCNYYIYDNGLSNVMSSDMYLDTKMKKHFVLNILAQSVILPQKDILHKGFKDILLDSNIKNTLDIKHIRYNGDYNYEEIKKQGSPFEKPLNVSQVLQINFKRTRNDLFFSPVKDIDSLKDFTIKEWWLHFLKCAPQYTRKNFQQIEKGGVVVPPLVLKAFKQISFHEWRPLELYEYKSKILETLALTKFSIERERGRREHAQEMAKKMILKMIDLKEICDMTDLSLEDVRVLHAEVLSNNVTDMLSNLPRLSQIKNE